jgi:hypothetical protein
MPRAADPGAVTGRKPLRVLVAGFHGGKHVALRMIV